MKVPHSNSFWLCFAVPVKKKNTFSFENTTTGLGVAFLLHVPSLQNIGIFTGQHYSTRSVFWQRADLVVSLQLLYRRSRIQSATWPTFQQSTHHIQPASQPAKQPDWPCPALLCSALPRIGCLQESSGLVLFWRAPVPNPSANIRQKLVNL